MKYTKRDYHYYEIVRKNIKKYRLLNKMSIEELADKMAISSACLKEIEDTKKEKLFSLSLLFKVSSILQIDLKDLFNEKDL